MLMAACDPGFSDEYTIDNQSSHDILFIWGGDWRYYPYENGRNFDGTYPVAAGQKATLPFFGGLGNTGQNAIINCALDFLLGDSVQFIVDGIDTLTFYASDTLGADSPYNFKSQRYTYDELPGPGSGMSWASLTFKVDDAMLTSANKK
ncbi:MAG: hypothetical protein IKQ53_02040 [Bacteroidales bacterium]|nr:hypothetical protein [Bacteroidales bacterium]